MDRPIPYILPAGQHHGTTLQSISCGEITLAKIRYDGLTSSSVHGNERASVMFVQRGRCLKELGRQRLDLASKVGMFLPPSELQRDTFPTATTFLAAEFSPALFARLNASTAKSDIPFLLRPTETAHLQNQLRRELAAPDRFSGVVLEGLLVSAVALVGRSFDRKRGNTPAWLVRAKSFLDEVGPSVPTLGEIALASGVHPSYLSREFKRWLGLSPGEYMRQARVERGKLALENTTLPLAAVAMHTGFADQAHFTRLFRRYVGLTPAEYRRGFRDS